jgi:group I intron endonuclease
MVLVNPNNWISGIYKIITPTGYYYIGSTKCLKNRCYKHTRNLRLNKHGNPHMQNRFNKYGDCWSMIALEYVEPSEEMLEYVEQQYIDRIINDPYCMNINPVAYRPPQTIIPWNKGIKTGPESIEIRNRKSAAKKGKAIGPFSKEHCQNISKALKGRKQSSSFILKRVQPLIGKKRTIEQRQHISISLKGKKKTKYMIVKKQLSGLLNNTIRHANIDITVLTELLNTHTLTKPLYDVGSKYLENIIHH